MTLLSQKIHCYFIKYIVLITMIIQGINSVKTVKAPLLLCKGSKPESILLQQHLRSTSN